MSTTNDYTWDDAKFSGLIGDQEIAVEATIKEPGNGSETHVCALFRYPGDEEKRNIYALRWKLGAVLDLGTPELDLAKGSVQTMLMMEDSDDD